MRATMMSTRGSPSTPGDHSDPYSRRFVGKMLDSKKSAFCFSAVTSTVMSSWTHHLAFVVWMRSVAVILRFFFAAKSYVQNGFEMPTLSTGGVVRTGSVPGFTWYAVSSAASRGSVTKNVRDRQRIHQKRLAHVRQRSGARARRKRRAAPGGARGGW